MKKGNLLIIDDEELLVKSMAFLLGPYAENIFTAYNGEEGLKEFNNHPIQCVICDINMPKMNGVEVLRQIRAQKSDVPFIFFTAYDYDELMLQAAKLGAYDFIRKPGFDGLEAIVCRGLEHGFKEKALSEEDKLLSEYEKILLDLKK